METIDKIDTQLSSTIDKLKKARIKLELLQESRLEVESERLTLNKTVDNLEKSRIIIQTVGQLTQQKLEIHISSLVTTALRAVFPNPPEFRLHFEVRRNQTEADLLFSDDGEFEYSPILGSGGGPLDVTSFALRVAFWSIRKNRRTLVLDEPFKFLSPDLHEKASEMLNLISKKLNLQIIMVSHSEEINVAADKTFLIIKQGQISTVKEL